ncbi:AbfB domain-containing protein [Streptomyces sp. PvR006]|uniref:AbfB domain-containing protein n=1 Tax=Streptomyces sp. PvR006 TaxID=2817860 RepID=UPI0027DC921B|nr:AbfB domain-containing protein [Streptomyces sp. PvR006]
MNRPGRFLRRADSRVRIAPDDGTALLRDDATFCARPGVGGTGVTFESFDRLGSLLRHYASAMQIASGSGPATGATGPRRSPRTAAGHWPRPGHPDRRLRPCPGRGAPRRGHGLSRAEGHGRGPAGQYRSNRTVSVNPVNPGHPRSSRGSEAQRRSGSSGRTSWTPAHPASPFVVTGRQP